MIQYKRIGQICSVLNGFAFKSENYVDSGLRIIRIANVQKGAIEDSQPVYYPLSTPNMDKYLLHEGDLLLSLTGNVGRVAILGREFLPAALNQRVACLRITDASVTIKYLFHILNSTKFENDCIQAANGVAQKNMSTEWLKQYEIPVYPVEIQENIVKELDKIQTVIQKRHKQISSFESLVKSQFIEMFEKGQQYEEISFGDICMYVRNGANIKQTKGAGGYPITRIETLSNDVFNSDRLGYADITDLSRYTNYLLKKGDILISHINSVAYLGRAVQYRGEVASPVIHGMNLLCARIKEDYNPTYIEWCLKSKRAKDYIATITKKAVNQASITTSDLKKMAIPVPPKEEQNLFARFVEQTDKSKIPFEMEVAA